MKTKEQIITQVDNEMKVDNPANELLKSFISQKFGLLRVVVLNDELWFVGKDVAKALGYKNTRKALDDHVDEEDKNTVTIRDGNRGNPNMVAINESGLYSLVLSSKLESAKEFKRWVTSEVIPSVRKYGVYATAETAEQFMNDPDFMIRTFTLLKKEREEKQKIQEENNGLKEENVGLRNVNKCLSRETANWDNKAIFTALIRSLGHNRFNNNYQYAYNTFYKELRYNKGIDLRNRAGKGPYINRTKDNEWVDIMEVLMSLCERNGIDITNVVNEVNAEKVMNH